MKTVISNLILPNGFELIYFHISIIGKHHSSFIYALSRKKSLSRHSIAIINSFDSNCVTSKTSITVWMHYYLIHFQCILVSHRFTSSFFTLQLISLYFSFQCANLKKKENYLIQVRIKLITIFCLHLLCSRHLILLSFMILSEILIIEFITEWVYGNYFTITTFRIKSFIISMGGEFLCKVKTVPSLDMIRNNTCISEHLTDFKRKPLPVCHSQFHRI